MGLLSYQHSQGYSYTDSDETSPSEDDQYYFRSTAKQRHKSTGFIGRIVLILIAIAIYTWLVVEICSFYWQRRMLHGPEAVESALLAPCAGRLH